MNRKVIGAFFILLLGLSMSMLLINIGRPNEPPRPSEIDHLTSEIALNPFIYNWDSYLTRSAGDNPLAIAIGDMNNDGQIDFVTANNNSGSLSIFIWNFTLADWVRKDWHMNPGCCDVAVGDANNDGLTDIVGVNKITNQINILLWNISRNNWTQVNYGIEGSPVSVAIGDGNNDHLNEMVITNYLDDSITIFTWNITVQTWNNRSVNVGNGPTLVEIGDVKNNGIKEIIIANLLDGNVEGIQWNGTLNDWFSDFIYDLEYFPSGLAIGDANNDGANEILIADKGNNSVTILTWNIQSKIWDKTSRGVGDQPSAVTVGDVNFDGQKDIITADYGDANISMLLWEPLQGDWVKSARKVGAGPMSVIVADINNNGLLEIATANSMADTVSILLWNTTLGELAPQTIRSVGSAPIGVAVGDANNDGENDIVTANSGTSEISVLCWNESKGNWNLKISLNVGHQSRSVCIGDANNDGANDIVSCGVSPNVSILIWNRSVKNWNPYIYRPISYYSGYEVFIADVNNDGANDIIVANADQAEISILFWNKTIMDWNPYYKLLGLGIPYHIGVNDLNNDGFNDVIASGCGSSRYIWFFLWNSSAGTWRPWQILFQIFLEPIFATPFSVGDANNDGLKDIVVGNLDQNNVSIFVWNATSQWWDTPQSLLVNGPPAAVAIGDINNDGEKDIVTVINESGRVGSITPILWNNSRQNWQVQLALDVGYDPRAVVIADATNDEENDAIITNFKENTVSIISFNRYPLILFPEVIPTFPQWTQDEDFGSVIINLTNFGIDAEDKGPNLVWVVSNLNLSLVQVSSGISINNTITFLSVENMYGSTTFQLSLRDSDYFQDTINITMEIRPVNDRPIILSKNQLRSNPIWVQSRDIPSFSINLTSYEFDAEDKGPVLKWFVQGLDQGIATVEGENSTDHVLIFSIQGTGTTTFTLFLMDSEGMTDNITIKLVVHLSSIDIFIRVFTPIVVGVVVVIGILYWRRSKARQTRESKVADSMKKAQKKVTE